MDNRIIVSVLVNNKRGALMRVSNVFTRRGINIRQLTVAEGRNSQISRITIQVDDDGDLDHKQLDKQLRKNEDVLDAVILKYEDTISRELLLVKMNYSAELLKQISEKLFEYSGKILSFDDKCLIGQIVASSHHIDTFLNEISNFDIVEISRSGVTSLDIAHKTFII